MRYVIMANGRGKRWNMFQGVPKHLLEIDGETLLQRTTRIVHELDVNAEVIISSSNPDCMAEGAKRYEPIRNELEIDRFVPELICDDMVFLYGDTYYTRESLSKIIAEPCVKLVFFGNPRSIVAIKVAAGKIMKSHYDDVRREYLRGSIDACKGWQVYHSYISDEYNLNVAKAHEMGPDFILLKDNTGDFNTPEDWLIFCAQGHQIT